MPSWKKVIISGSDASLSSLFVSNAITASIFSGSHIGPLTGTASWASNAVNANTASYVLNAVSSSYSTFANASLFSYGVRTIPSGVNTNWYIPYVYYSDTDSANDHLFQSLSTTSSLTYNPVTQLLTATASRAVSSSFASTASYVLNAISSSFASTASFVNQLNQNVVITGSLTVSGSAAYSITARAITLTANGAPYIKGGDDAEIWDVDRQDTLGIYGTTDQGIGSLKLGSGGGILTGRSGSLGVNMPLNWSGSYSGSLHVNGGVFATSFTGSLFGTASQAISSSFATTASYILNAVSASWAGVASSSIVTGTTADATHSLIFTSIAGTNTTGTLGLLTNTSQFGIRYNPYANSLSSFTSYGLNSGLNTVITSTANASYYPIFANDQYQAQLLINSSYRFNPETNTLTVTNVSASVVTASATLIGTASAQTLSTTFFASGITIGSLTLYSVPTASYDSIFFKYVLKSGSRSRHAGEVYGIRSGSEVIQIGGTSTVPAATTAKLGLVILGGNLVITGSFTSANWEVKGIVQAI